MSKKKTNQQEDAPVLRRHKVDGIRDHHSNISYHCEMAKRKQNSDNYIEKNITFSQCEQSEEKEGQTEIEK